MEHAARECAAENDGRDGDETAADEKRSTAKKSDEEGRGSVKHMPKYSPFASVFMPFAQAHVDGCDAMENVDQADIHAVSSATSSLHGRANVSAPMAKRAARHGDASGARDEVDGAGGLKEAGEIGEAADGGEDGEEDVDSAKEDDCVAKADGTHLIIESVNVMVCLKQG